MGDQVHPVVDFPVYGLVAAWPAARWLDFIAGEAGGTIQAMWLMQADGVPGPSTRWLAAGSLSADLREETLLAGEDWTREVASLALQALTNRTSPVEFGPNKDREQYRQDLLRWREEQAERHRAWGAASWTVGGEPVKARTFSWAGSWTAYSVSDVATTIVAVGHGIPPNNLFFEVLSDGRNYHFELTKPINYPRDLASSRQTGLRNYADYLVTWPVHMDHELLARS